jgi:cytochrome P450
VPDTATTHTAAHLPDELDAAFTTNPHELYQLLRKDHPVLAVRLPQGPRIWLVTRYSDVRAALVDPRLAKDATTLDEILRRRGTSLAEHRVPFVYELTLHMLNSDPPDHARLRKLVSRAFTPRAIDRLRPRIEEIATELADTMSTQGPVVDLIDAFAFHLPVQVISEILGIPSSDLITFRDWTTTLLSLAPLEQRRAVGQESAEYLTELVAAKRAHPGQDMLSTIVAASEDTDQLSKTEAVAMAFLLIIAGHETTVNLIGNGMLALLRNPDQLAELRANPALLPGAVEELLRLDGPINLATMRFTTEPVTIAGTTIAAGEVVMVSLGSANRDPDQYLDADQLDIRREASNLAFGHGLHYCLGAPLARLEGKIALRTLLDRFPGMTLAQPPEQLHWRSNATIRGLDRLLVRLT